MNISLALSHSRPNTQWSMSNDDYSTLQWFGPGEPPTMEELEAAWNQLQARKIWPTVSEFWSEFTNTEKLGIADSVIPDIRLLQEELRMWRGEVWSDDIRVQNGLSGLVSSNILTETRKSEILSL